MLKGNINTILKNKHKNTDTICKQTVEAFFSVKFTIMIC